MNCNVFIADIQELENPEAFEKGLEEISAYRKKKVLDTKGNSRLLSLGAGLLLKKALQNFKIDEQTVLYEENEQGKPFFKDYSHLSFNLSHSGTKVMCLICDEPIQIGCDIEKIRKINLKIANRFFNKREVELINSIANETQRQQKFFQIWTAKESYIKAVGKGLLIPLNSFIVDSENQIILNEDQETKGFIKHFTFDDYDSTICCLQNPVSPNITYESLLM